MVGEGENVFRSCRSTNRLIELDLKDIIGPAPHVQGNCQYDNYSKLDA
jgi:hypothetical protein